MSSRAMMFILAVVWFVAIGNHFHNRLKLLEQQTEQTPTCTVERVTFPASAKECARIHKAIERRIANETT